MSEPLESTGGQASELVLRWLDLRLRDGQAPSPAELCREHPELLDEVTRRLEALQAVAGVPNRPRLEDTQVAAGPPLPRLHGYEVEGLLGQGGMGAVYKARQLALGRQVALKLLHRGSHDGPRERQRFRLEAEALAALQHPHIVQVFEVGDADGHPYLAMEYLDGGSLAERLQQGPLAPSEAARLGAVLADAVQRAHQAGIVHRDLKPANVLLTADGTPKVSDFGLARKLEGGLDFTRTGEVMGTPLYMAPEQAAGRGHLAGPAADVYALGVILYEMLTGQPPFGGATAVEVLLQVVHDEPAPPSRHNRQVPRDLEVVCLKCLAKEPRHRYATAQELAGDLRRFLEDRPIQARPAGQLEPVEPMT
jgi:serine/threonine-protein kinase